MGRRRATLVSSAIALVGGLLCAFSFGPLSDLTIAGMTIFELFDYFTSNIALPVGGMIVSIFVGWMLNRPTSVDRLAVKSFQGSLMMACLRWVCPGAILLILLNSIGLL